MTCDGKDCKQPGTHVTEERRGKLRTRVLCLFCYCAEREKRTAAAEKAAS